VLQSNELMDLFIPLLRSDFAVYETYSYSASEPLACGITALGGLQDAQVSNDDLLAWRKHTSGSFEVCNFPGNHFFINTATEDVLTVFSSILLDDRLN
jgi:medium-chain acyl-[acyl-carrier-protein] hydrolase